MSFASIIVLALGLSMDATAAAAARGLAAPRLMPRHVALVAALFGGFQALMPLLGWFVGAFVGPAAQAWDHWIAFVLLSAIGGKLLWDARSAPAEAGPLPRDPFDLGVLVVLALATSIDAFAAGVTLPLLGAPMLVSLLTIGLTTAFSSALGLFAGRRFGALLGRRLDAVGGLALIGLGVKILAEHS